MKIQWVPSGTINSASNRVRCYFIDRELKKRGIQSGIRSEIENPDIIVYHNPVSVDYDFEYTQKKIIDLVDGYTPLPFIVSKSTTVVVETEARVEKYKQLGIEPVVIHDTIDYTDKPFRKTHQISSVPTFVWFGCRHNFNAEVISQLDVKVTVICEDGKDLPENCEFKKWNYDTFVDDVRDFDYALLPVHNVENGIAKSANKLLTAVTLGLVPIVGEVRSYVDILRKVYGEWIACYDIDLWKYEIEKLSKMPFETYNRHLDLLQPYVWKNYNVKKITDDWMDIFQKII